MTTTSEKPRVSVVAVTPKMAEQWLGKNIKNRNLSEATVAAYAQDMANGDWLINGEAIKFDKEGNLFDGQHRLHASIRSGSDFQTVVVRELDAVSVKTIDAGRKRTMANVLTMRGESYPNQIAAIARRGVMWDLGEFTNTGRIHPTYSQMDSWISQNQSTFQAAEFASLMGAAKVLPSSVVGLCYVMFGRIDVFDASFFLERTCRGSDYFASKGVLDDAVTQRRQQPASALRRKVLGLRNIAGGRVPETTLLAFTILAWNSMRAGQERHKFSVPADGWGGNFPEPK